MTCLSRASMFLVVERNKRVLAIVLALVTPPAVAKPIMVDGYQLKAREWEKASVSLLDTAAFDVGCPKEQIQLQVISVFRVWLESDYAQSVGVRGCGKQLRYVRHAVGGPWLLNVDLQPPSEAPEPAPAPPQTAEPPASPIPTPDPR